MPLFLRQSISTSRFTLSSHGCRLFVVGDSHLFFTSKCYQLFCRGPTCLSMSGSLFRIPGVPVVEMQKIIGSLQKHEVPLPDIPLSKFVLQLSLEMHLDEPFESCRTSLVKFSGSPPKMVATYHEKLLANSRKTFSFAPVSC